MAEDHFNSLSVCVLLHIVCPRYCMYVCRLYACVMGNGDGLGWVGCVISWGGMAWHGVALTLALTLVQGRGLGGEEADMLCAIGG